MIGSSERRSVEFLQWETRGRGYAVWPHPVVPEPPFAPYVGRPAVEQMVRDDGRKETFLSRSLRRLSERLAPPAAPPVEEQEAEEPPPILIRDGLVELQAHLPPTLGFDSAAYARLFGSLAVCAEPLAFEILATAERITAQFAVHPKDERLVNRQFAAFFPDVGFVRVTGALAKTWGDAGQPNVAMVDFGLGKEFMNPLDFGRAEPFVGVIGALEEIEADEVALFQVIFTPTRLPWEESIIRSVTHADGSALFVNAKELLDGARQKTSQPLFAAVVRVATRSPKHERSWEIACNVAGALGAYGSSHGNELVPLKNDGYPAHEHELDVLARQTHRSGMILNAAELVGFVHVPSGDVRSPRLRRVTEKTKPAPISVRSESGLVLGTNEHAGNETRVVLTDETRVRHVHIIGASGTGKSTLLFNLIEQDLKDGYGLTVLDPHGDLIDRVLGVVPKNRIGDVVLLDPSDEEFAVGFNVLAAHSDWERDLLASDLVAVFRRLSTAWGDQLNSVLSNALLAFMESDRGGTLVDVRRFLLEPAFRAEFLKTVRDANVRYYWERAFPALSGNKSVGPVVTRLDTFLSPKPVRYMVAQKENKIDFADIIGSGKILLAKLSEGFIGKENSYLLGSFLVSRLQSAAMARQRESESSRRFHTLYADEFHNFLTPSLAECLSGVRKYRLGLVLAHQEMRQAERDSDVASALLNAGTRIVFRLGDRDARSLENGFANFEARDIQNLEIGRAICRVERSDWDFNLKVTAPEESGSADFSPREEVIAASRARYATPRGDVERTLALVVESEPARPRKEANSPSTTPQPPPVAHSAVPVTPAPMAVPAAAPLPIEKPAVRLTSKDESRQSKPAAPVEGLGRGGAQHKTIQRRIREAAEALGFRATIEKTILDGAGSIDLALERRDMAFACEIAVSTTVDHEVGNVAKCAKAGWKRIAAISVTPKRLAELETAVSTSLGVEIAHLVTYHLPNAFIEHLRTLPPPEPTAPEIKTVKGYKVKTTFPKLSPAEAKAKEDAAIKVMAELMRANKKVR